MSATIDRVRFTDHAREAWRARVAVYGDEGAAEIFAALKEAIPLKPDDPRPSGLPFKEGFRYFQHATKPSVYFVAEAVDIGDVRLITVRGGAGLAHDRIHDGREHDAKAHPGRSAVGWVGELQEQDHRAT